MAKVRLFDKEHGTYTFLCPAGHHHYINTNLPNHKNAQWSFNGDVNNPTFSPSMDEKSGRFVDPNVKGDEQWLNENSYRCHFIITNGMIQFCGDCSHELKGQTMPLPDLDELKINRYENNEQ